MGNPYEYNVEALNAIDSKMAEIKALVQRIADQVAPESEPEPEEETVPESDT